MIPITITPISLTAPIPGFPSGNISEDAPHIPPAIAALAPGTLLKGFVLNRDGNGNPILRTNLGDFLIKSSFFLKIGSDVTVKIEAWGRNFRANIIEVDNKPVQPDGNTPPKSPGTNTQTGTREDTITRSPLAQSGDATRNNPAIGSKLNAVLLSTSGNLPASFPRPGAVLQLQISNVQLPTTAAFPTANPAAASASASAAATPQTTGNIVGNSPATPLLPSAAPTPAGNASAVSGAATPSALTTTQVSGSTAQTALPPIAPHTSFSQPITLTVIGQEQDGEPVLQTPFGLIKVTSHANLPTGTQVTALVQQIVSTATTGAAAGGEPDLPHAIADFAQGWQSFRQILSLFPADTAGASSLLAATQLPALQLNPNQPIIQPQQLTAGLFLFMAALKGGNFRDWIGEAQARALEASGHGTLLRQAEGEFTLMSRLFNDSGQPWQSLFLPVLVNGEMQMVRFFSKRDRKKDGQGRETRGDNTRFIVEVSLSELGALQFDGFYRKQPEARNLDLIIRAETPLETSLQQEVIGIYSTLIEAAGLGGSLTFQWVRQFPIHPLEAIMQEPPEMMV